MSRGARGCGDKMEARILSSSEDIGAPETRLDGQPSWVESGNTGELAHVVMVLRSANAPSIGPLQLGAAQGTTLVEGSLGAHPLPARGTDLACKRDRGSS